MADSSKTCLSKMCVPRSDSRLYSTQTVRCASPGWSRRVEAVVAWMVTHEVRVVYKQQEVGQFNLAS